MPTLVERKESLHRKTFLLQKDFKDQIPEAFFMRLEDIMLDFAVDLDKIDEAKVERNEIKDQLQEGFRRMDKRFEQVEVGKRFDAVVNWLRIYVVKYSFHYFFNSF